MPTYDYECGKCGHRFELFQKMSDKPVSPCPKCKKDAHRLIGTGSGVIFKGSGFYQTDYKNPSTRAQDSIPSEARDKNKKKSKQEKSCPKSDSSSGGCDGCSVGGHK